ncbi:MAG: biotin--[acetyl-CoA-carboxylase] ligase [Deltaproteobacteria bacterium]|nr:biotin--[acetyl-CoA-carboxylase] ligase [Deltaproteobacteria bacterium]
MESETSKNAFGENAEPFNLAFLTVTLENCLFGKRVIFRDTLGSTNVFLKELAQKGAVEGTVVIADEQSAGLGRLGRQWFSKKGENLLFSVLLRPELPASKIFSLTMRFALAGIDAIHEISGLNAMIKWPNDIYIGQKKIGGILTEFSVMEGMVQYVILGMGLNVNWKPELEQTLLYSTSSILNETKRRVSREGLLCKLLKGLENNYNVAKGDMEEREGLFERWNEKSLVLGKTVTVETGKERVEGKVKGIDRDGALMLITADGQKRKFVCGDVSVKMIFSKKR